MMRINCSGEGDQPNHTWGCWPAIHRLRMQAEGQRNASFRLFLHPHFSETNRTIFSTQTNLPVFRVKESSVRRRFSDFEWLRNELERDSKIVVPALPSKAIKRQLPFRGDDGDSFPPPISHLYIFLQGYLRKTS